MLEYIYVCRHGFRSNWVDPNIKTGPTGLPRDPPLAVYGVTQAGRLAEFLSSPEALAPYPVPERVFSSPFYRCIQTAEPAVKALQKQGVKEGLALEHGVSEWYSPVIPNTGLHPRPGDSAHLEQFFPTGLFDHSYSSALYPSRRGESLKGLQDRADLFVEAWTARCEEMGYKVVVVFAHAASVIAIGRALTGDKTLDISAGCASCSLYKRKVGPTSSTSFGSVEASGSSSEFHTSRSTSSLAAASGLLALSTVPNGSDKVDEKERLTQANGDSGKPSGVGEWEAVFTGRADYLDKGVERDWSFRDVVFADGEVVHDAGDGLPHPPEDTIPVGLAPGMERYLRRGIPPKNHSTAEIQQKSKI